MQLTDDQIQGMVDERQQLLRAGAIKNAEHIRSALAGMGILIQDCLGETEWRRITLDDVGEDTKPITLQ